MVQFFSPEEEAAIVSAIRHAEAGTTGEIRVHLEFGAKQDALSESKSIFHRLGMHETRDRNGVLILLEVDRQEFAIIGDVGITKKVSEDFWKEERDLLQNYFRRRAFMPGLVLAIEQIGAKLKRFFPAEGATDNQLPNEISYGH
ncbi:MAG: TPM domain-containing protein [Bacteroidota bacterium]